MQLSYDALEIQHIAIHQSNCTIIHLNLLVSGSQFDFGRSNRKAARLPTEAAAPDETEDGNACHDENGRSGLAAALARLRRSRADLTPKHDANKEQQKRGNDERLITACRHDVHVCFLCLVLLCLLFFNA